MANNNQSSYADNRKEGDVTINTNNKNSKKFNKSDGDYIDYEELD
jgi:hypothetical protein